MGRIDDDSLYAEDQNLSGEETVIGTDENGETVQIKLSKLAEFIVGIPAPQVVISEEEEELVLVPTSKVMIVTVLPDVEDVRLPVITGNEGLIILLTNATGADININSNDGVTTDIWDSGVDVATKVAINGSMTRLTNDGLSYRTQ